jgi:hypothetical protein
VIVVLLVATIWLGLLVVVLSLLTAAARADRELEAARVSARAVPSRPRLRALPGGAHVSGASSSSGKPTALAGRSSRSPL